MQEETKRRPEVAVLVPRKLLWALKYEAWRRQISMKKLVASVLTKALDDLRTEHIDIEPLDRPTENAK